MRLSTFPNGLLQELTKDFSEEGTDLSGGEAQELAVARAFYKNAGLVFLDEPSAALDSIAEYQLNRAMKRVAFMPRCGKCRQADMRSKMCNFL